MMENQYDWIIIGAGIAGAKLFYHLSEIGSCLIIDQGSPLEESARYRSARVICAHDFPWMQEVPFENKDIFPRDHMISIYASRFNEAYVKGEEFGKSLGKIADQFNLIQWYLQQGLAHGGTILQNQKVMDAIVTEEKAEVIISNSNKISARIIILATGSKSDEITNKLRQKLGISELPVLNTITATFEGSESQIEQNLKSDYMYCLHPKISNEGMLWMTRSRTYFNIGMVSSEKKSVIIPKFLRILRNYKPIQEYFRDLIPSLATMTYQDLKICQTSKFIISKFISSRTIAIGDAAGLLYPLYFEGVVGSVISASLLFQTLNNLKKLENSDQDSNLNRELALMKYKDELQHNFIDYYYKAGLVGDSLFFNGPEKPKFTIWDSYLIAIKKMKKIRQNIVTAYTCDDLAHYPFENDQWCGEQIFKHLPISKKVALTPFFLKMILQKNN